MNIAIIGANSAVGTELSVLLDRRGHDVLPVVRNRLAASFLRQFEFDVELADFSDPDPKTSVLDTADVVVVAARAGDDNLRVRSRTNRRLITNAVRATPRDGAVVFFSSISALGRELHGSQMDTVPGIRNYIYEKREAEGTFRDECDRLGKSGYTFRLGHVFGANQERTRDIGRTGKTTDPLAVTVDPNAPSNVVSTATVAESIVACGRHTAEPGRYTVVNDPQWSWDHVLRCYVAPGTTIRYFEPDTAESSGRLRQVIDVGWSLLERIGGDRLYPLRVRLPERIESYALAKGKREYVGTQIADLRQGRERDLHLSIFEHDPVRPESVTDTPSMAEIVGEEREMADAFDFPGVAPSPPDR
ncbi:NAD-dependent epimerase/dehydratase family protein [Haloplanus pelagicus]|uniref:NAD-dependent epimerase/dehydratase family protein n=1 Tax=Haloplanus pelagicus TaxID=2949995 RepID=UPI00203FA8F1|nr:NAD(P)H-binding protein [Haloplanus sp. HW8-1]